jgi:pimeloyl-ACP methyl ester carboxylesterase
VVQQLRGGDILVGHSMGAAVAVVAADARPDLIRHITPLSGPLPVQGQCLSYQSTLPSVGGSTSDEGQDSVSGARRPPAGAVDGVQPLMTHPGGLSQTAGRSQGPFEMMTLILCTVKDRGAKRGRPGGGARH